MKTLGDDACTPFYFHAWHGQLRYHMTMTMHVNEPSSQSDEPWPLRERAMELRCLYTVISALSRRAELGNAGVGSDIDLIVVSDENPQQKKNSQTWLEGGVSALRRLASSYTAFEQ